MSKRTLSSQKNAGLIPFIRAIAAGEAGAPSSSGGDPVLVYRPGGVTAGNVYATVAALAPAAKALQGPKTIFVDNSVILGDAHIPVAGMPVGGWDFGLYVTWQGDSSLSLGPSGFGLVFDDGAQVASPVIYDGANAFTTFQDLNVTSNSTSAVYTLAGHGPLPITLEGTTKIKSANSPMFVGTDPTGILYVSCYGESIIAKGGSQVFTGPQGKYAMYDFSNLEAS